MAIGIQDCSTLHVSQPYAAYLQSLYCFETAFAGLVKSTSGLTNLSALSLFKNGSAGPAVIAHGARQANVAALTARS
jgi:hypothetical protein